eukprot:gene6126-7349_t
MNIDRPALKTLRRSPVADGRNFGPRSPVAYRRNFGPEKTGTFLDTEEMISFILDNENAIPESLFPSFSVLGESSEFIKENLKAALIQKLAKADSVKTAEAIELEAMRRGPTVHLDEAKAHTNFAKMKAVDEDSDDEEEDGGFEDEFPLPWDDNDEASTSWTVSAVKLQEICTANFVAEQKRGFKYARVLSKRGTWAEHSDPKMKQKEVVLDRETISGCEYKFVRYRML